jgi:hypothetical protein
MTEHELTSLPGCVARYWNADNPNAGNHGTTQGLVGGFSDGFCGQLTGDANLKFIRDAKDCDELQPIV